MLLVFVDRKTLLQALPPNAVAAEIGTAEGDFSASILDVAKPKCLHLIDPWCHVEDAAFKVDPNNTDDVEGERRFNAVKQRFSTGIESGQVVIHRAFSTDVVDDFPDEYFDYIYIDGNHTYEAVKADLNSFDRKVKAGGLILGHDYVTHASFRQMNFGVVEAVNEFIREKKYKFVCLTHEGSPTYAIAKDPQSPMAQALESMILSSPIQVLEIVDAENRRMRQWDVYSNGRPLRTVMGFD